MSSTLYPIVKSFIIVPLLATSVSMNAFTASINTALEVMSTPVEAQSIEEIALQKEREEKAAKIDAYYAKRGMPLEGYGMKMVLEAEKYDLPYNLIPAIGVRESTGGKFACKSVTYSPFGFGSCRINFQSYDHAIEIVAKNLGGENPNTARAYKGKTLEGKLKSYNSVIPEYKNEIFALMSSIDNTAI